jgi:hypothetical protein
MRQGMADRFLTSRECGTDQYHTFRCHNCCISVSTSNPPGRGRRPFQFTARGFQFLPFSIGPRRIGVGFARSFEIPPDHALSCSPDCAGIPHATQATGLSYMIWIVPAISENLLNNPFDQLRGKGVLADKLNCQSECICCTCGVQKERVANLAVVNNG